MQSSNVPRLRALRLYHPRALALAALLTACGSDGPTGPGVTAARRLDVVVQPPEAVTAGVPFPAQPVVQVQDAAGNAVRQAEIRVSAAARGSTLLGTPFAMTGADGRAAFTDLALRGAPGTYTLVFSAPGLEADSIGVSLNAGVATTMAAATSASQAGIAGEAVAAPPAVRVTDEGGNPVAGVTVTFAVTSGGGSVAGATPVSGSDGIATLGSWTLGPAAGTNTVTAAAAGLGGSPLTFIAIAGARGTVTSTPAPAHTPIGTAVSPAPAVVVTGPDGQPLAGVPVTFTVVSGGGTVAGAEQVTASDGFARVTSWTVGAVPGLNELRAETPPGYAGNPRSFVTEARGSGPSQLAINGGDGQEATVLTTLPIAPSVIVKDAAGAPVAGYPITFQANGGTITGAATTSGTDGVARVGSWTLGSAAGPQTLSVATPFGNVVITATALAGPAVRIQLEQGDGQTGGVRRFLPTDPAVRVFDAHDNPASASVSFTVTGGGGSGGGTITTDGSGVAAARWKLGSEPGMNTMRATLAGAAASYDFTATATPVVSNFSIELRYLSPVSASQQAIFSAAAFRWSDIVLGDVPAASVAIAAGACFDDQPALNEVIDDVVIFVDVVAIDGPGGVLGSAGPCVVRSSSSLPAVGLIQLDAADANALESAGELAGVVRHEVGHVLGIGTIWSRLALLIGAGTSDPRFVGTSGVNAYHDMGGGESAVPVEGTGGAGTADSHWRESTFGNELMTGYISGTVNPLTALTIGSLQDLGYAVDFGTADTLTAPPSLRRAPVPRLLREVPLESPIIVVGAEGSVLFERRRTH